MIQLKNETPIKKQLWLGTKRAAISTVDSVKDIVNNQVFKQVFSAYVINTVGSVVPFGFFAGIGIQLLSIVANDYLSNRMASIQKIVQNNENVLKGINKDNIYFISLDRFFLYVDFDSMTADHVDEIEKSELTLQIKDSLNIKDKIFKLINNKFESNIADDVIKTKFWLKHAFYNFLIFYSKKSSENDQVHNFLSSLEDMNLYDVLKTNGEYLKVFQRIIKLTKSKIDKTVEHVKKSIDSYKKIDIIEFDTDIKLEIGNEPCNEDLLKALYKLTVIGFINYLNSLVVYVGDSLLSDFEMLVIFKSKEILKTIEFLYKKTDEGICTEIGDKIKKIKSNMGKYIVVN